MAFAPGNKLGKGRPKNSPNRTTAQVKDFLMSISEQLEADLLNDIKELQSLDRVKLWLSIQEYIIPKMARIETKSDDNDKNLTITIVSPKPDYSKLSIQELYQLEDLLQKAGINDEPILEEED
jgi:hypothetical protein